jgi:hypothetical protein
LALLRVLVRIADSATGLIEDVDDDTGLGFVRDAYQQAFLSHWYGLASNVTAFPESRLLDVSHLGYPADK